MKSLHGRRAVDIGIIERLAGDSDALVRKEAVAALLELGKPLIEEEIKKILLPPQREPRSFHRGLGSAAGSDEAGKEILQQYQLDVLKKLSETELEKRVGASPINDDSAYFALAERYFRNHVDDLRCNIDDKFSAYFEERIRRTEADLGDGAAHSDLIKSWRDLEQFRRKKLTRRGLDVLCDAQKPQDLQRVRSNLRDGYAEASKHDVEYLGKHGEWTDIPILANAKGPSSLGATLLTMSGGKEFQAEVARAITSIGKKHSVSDLLSLEMPAAILKKTIELCAESRFEKISRNALLALFNHESQEVRKAAAVLAVRALPKKQIKAILHEYVGSEKYRYYNVIHWLDLGASMSRSDAKKGARATGS
jgi:hypothetical protein